MIDRILIAFGTMTGATRGVAETVAETLRAYGADVTVQRAREVGDVGAYRAVLIGAPVYAGQLSGEVRRFVRRHRKALTAVPMAGFVVCLAAADDKEENRQLIQGYVGKLNQLAPEAKLVDVGVFAGAVLTDTPEYARLFPLLKIPVGGMAKSTPDHRNWEAIRRWAETVYGKL